jgi:extracellular matrix regulatory protein B
MGNPRMYIHIGGEYVISDKFVIGIFDFDGTTVQPSETIGFLSKAEQAGRIEMVSQELPRSFVVTLDRIYVTPISPGTLHRRLAQPDGTEAENDHGRPEKR